MAEFLQVNSGTIAVGLVVLFVLAAAVLKMRKDKKKGSSCCGGCAGCPSQGMCHSEKTE